MAKEINLPWKTEKEFYELHSKDIFSKYAFYHSTMIGKTKEDFLLYIIKNARINKNSKIVDLGCGSGYLTYALSLFCKEVIGISNSEECIKQAKKNYPKNKFEIANMETFKIKGMTHFLALESLGYSNIKKTFKNISQNLEKGGLFYIKDFILKNNLTEKIKKDKEWWENYWKYKLIKLNELLKIAEENNFTLLEYKNLQKKDINYKPFIESLKLNKVEYKPPYKKDNFAIASEFLFVKN